MTQRQIQGNTLFKRVSDSVEKQHICPSAHLHFELNIMKETLLQGPQRSGILYYVFYLYYFM